VIRDPWAVTLFDAISYDYRKFAKPNQSHALRARAFDAATPLDRFRPLRRIRPSVTLLEFGS
jgi:hypothetical protein